MGLLSDLTYYQLEVISTVEQLQGSLDRVRRMRHEPERARQTLLAMKPSAQELRTLLENCFQYEQDRLFPRVHRVLGEAEEVAMLRNYHRLIIDSIDRFIEELPEEPNGEEASLHPIQLAYLHVLFSEFLELYEYHSAVERTFYQLYSTILFPGGAVAD